MNTYIVADGGGTKTEFLWFGEDGTVFATARTGGSNALFISPEKAASNVREGILACFASRPDVQPPRLVLLFIPGFSCALPILKKEICVPQIKLMDDFWNAFYGALGAPHGIVALAGTGSFVVGRCTTGPLLTVGGWGPTIGDEGSGYRLGVLCLKEVTRQYDEGKEKGLLANLLLNHMGIQNVIDIQAAAYRPSFTREKMAELSFVVEEAARAGDPDAIRLFELLTDELVDQIVRMANRLNQPALPVSVTGGMTKAGKLFSDAFCCSLKRKAPELLYTPCKYSPLIGGALYLFSELLGISVTDGVLAKRIVSCLTR